MGFLRQEYWSGLPFPSPGDLPDPGIQPASLAVQADSLPSEPPGKLHVHVYQVVKSSIWWRVFTSAEQLRKCAANSYLGSSERSSIRGSGAGWGDHPRKAS